MFRGGFGGNEDGSREDKKKVLLDENYFRRVEKYAVDVAKFRGWSFDFLVAVGQIDGALADDLRKITDKPFPTGSGTGLPVNPEN